MGNVSCRSEDIKIDLNRNKLLFGNEKWIQLTQNSVQW